MENSDNNVIQTVNQSVTGEPASETQTAAKKERKKTAVSANIEKAKSKDGNNKPTKGSERSGLGAAVENEAISGEGGNIENSIKPAPETPKTAEEKRRAAMAARIFERKNVDAVFFTSDGIPFGAKTDALRQAAKLTNKTIIEYTKKL